MSAPSSAETRQLTELIRDQIIWEESSAEVREYANQLPDDNDEALKVFCDRYELGVWFYEALQAHDVSLAELLEGIAVERAIAEEEARTDYAEVERDRRHMQSPG